MSQADNTRLTTELELLEAMFPGQIDYNAKGRDFKFSDRSALLHLRIPELYPDAGLPDVISASDAAKNDVRDRTKAAASTLGLADGEEALDAIIACFEGIVAETRDINNSHADPVVGSTASTREPSKTVVVWLHHLLALGKRKLALSPPCSVAGITKPGYPGIMVFTGAVSAVKSHLDTLKAENWQAFQVRYEDDELWEFAQGAAVREVETMAEVVKAIEFGEDGSRRKLEFLKAVGIK